MGYSSVKFEIHVSSILLAPIVGSSSIIWMTNSIVSFVESLAGGPDRHFLWEFGSRASFLECVHSPCHVEPLGSLDTLAYYLPVVILVGEVLQAGAAAYFVALLAYQLRLLGCFLWYFVGALLTFENGVVSSGNGSTFGVGLNRQFILDHQVLFVLIYLDLLPFLLGEAKVVSWRVTRSALFVQL